MRLVRIVAVAAVVALCRISFAGLTLENEDFAVRRVYPRNRIEKLSDGRDGVRVTFFPGEFAGVRRFRKRRCGSSGSPAVSIAVPPGCSGLILPSKTGGRCRCGCLGSRCCG